MVFLSIISIIFGIFSAINFYVFFSKRNMGITVWGKNFIIFILAAVIAVSTLLFGILWYKLTNTI